MPEKPRNKNYHPKRLKRVNYLDVTFNLNNGSFKPYRKPDNQAIQSAKEFLTYHTALHTCYNLQQGTVNMHFHKKIHGQFYV